MKMTKVYQMKRWQGGSSHFNIFAEKLVLKFPIIFKKTSIKEFGLRL